MSENKNQPNFVEWLTKNIAPIISFFILLVAVINTIQGWLGSYEQARGVSIAGYILYLLTTYWVVFKRKVPQAWGWTILGILLISTGAYFFWLGTSWKAVSSSQLSPSPLANNLVKYFDFEKSAAGWEDIVRWDANWTNAQTIRGAAILPSEQGERGVAYDLRVDAGGWLNYIIEYSDPVQADVVVVNLYLPDSQDIEDENWAGIIAVDGKLGDWLARSTDSIPLGKWTQMVLDLRDIYDSNDIPLNSRPVFIQVVYSIKGKAKLKSDTVRARLADVAWYRDAGGKSALRGEQRGMGRKLFDFESEGIGDWQIAGGRVQTDTIKLSGERVYRGKYALKWETRLVSGDNKSFIKTVWRGSSPQGGWTARVYLPDNVPTGVSVWANFYTYSKSDWQGNEPFFLTKGMWNTLVWDTHNVDWGTIKDFTIGIQIGAEGGSYQGPIYIDDIQIFER